MTRTRPAALRKPKASHGAHGDTGAHNHGKPEHHGSKLGSKLRKHKSHKPKQHKHKHKPKPRHHSSVSGLAGAPSPPMVPVNPPAPSPSPPPVIEDPLTLARARRLLWRAGFGPAPGQAEALVGQSLQQVVYSLTRPSGPAVLNGPNRTTKKGKRCSRRTTGATTTAGGWTA